MPAGLRVAELGDRSLEAPGLISPLYSFEGSRFQCFPGEDKPAKKKKPKPTNNNNKKIKLVIALQNCARRVWGQKLSLTFPLMPQKQESFQAGGSTLKD